MAATIHFKRGRASHTCLSILCVVRGVVPWKIQITEVGCPPCAERTNLTCNSVGASFREKKIHRGTAGDRSTPSPIGSALASFLWAAFR